MIRSIIQASMYAAIVAFGLAEVSQAEDISTSDCEKIRAAFVELATANQTYANMALDIQMIQFDFLLAIGPGEGTAKELYDKYASALETAPDLNGQVVGQGAAAFRSVCPQD